MTIPDIAPLDATGTLGVLHLKRFWSRALAARAGNPSASTGEPAADNTLLCGLHLGHHEAISFLMETVPSFEQFEAWVLEINGGFLDPSRVVRINAALTGALDPGTPPATDSASAALTAEDLVHWDRDGYVILHDAVSPDQSHAAAQAIYDFLGVDPLDPETWYRNPRGHSIWVPLLRHPAFQANRESPRIHAAFAQLWGRTDLWASIDQGGFNPPERPGWPFPGPHLHWDTSLAPPVPFGLQAILYLTDTSAEQGAFTCVPGFHRCLQNWLAGLPQGADPRAAQWMRTLPAVPIPGRAGDLVIWHQALPHGASPNRTNRPRVSQYLKLLPSQYAVNPIWR